MANKPPLEGKVAVVAGATRGAGRGVARALGEAGALVYCTGRSVAGDPSPYDRPETLDETVAMIEQAGGKAVLERVDHTEEDQVEALFAGIEAEHRRLDVLVNSAGGEDPAFGDWGPFWDADLSGGMSAINNSLISHIVTAKHAARLMMKRENGLIVEITDGDLPAWGGTTVLAQVSKAGAKTLARLLSWELRDHGVAVLAISPGFLRSEKMLEHFGVSEDNWRDGGKQDKYFLHSETPLFVGRAVAALAADPRVMERSGDLTSSWELARGYDFTDYDGRVPDFGLHFPIAFAETDWMRAALEREVEFLERMVARAKGYLGRS